VRKKCVEVKVKLERIIGRFRHRWEVRIKLEIKNWIR